MTKKWAELHLLYNFYYGGSYYEMMSMYEDNEWFEFDAMYRDST